MSATINGKKYRYFIKDEKLHKTEDKDDAKDPLPLTIGNETTTLDDMNKLVTRINEI